MDAYSTDAEGNMGSKESRPLNAGGGLSRKTKTQLNKLNCVFDEAHSLPDYAVNLLSNELSTISITRAMKEAEEYGVDDGGVLEAAYGFIQSEGERTYRRLGLDSEGIIEKERLSEAFRESTGLSLGEIAELVSELYEEGELIRRRRIERGESPLVYFLREGSSRKRRKRLLQDRHQMS